jgi:hypothetical protein
MLDFAKYAIAIMQGIFAQAVEHGSVKVVIPRSKRFAKEVYVIR